MSKQIYKRILQRHPESEIVHYDLAGSSQEDLASKLASNVSGKDHPTVMLRADDSLFKLDPDSVNESFELRFEQEVSRCSNVKLIWSPKDLSDSLKAGNVELDDMTAVYCRDPDLNKDVERLAINYMRHESGKRVLQVVDKDLAEKLQMKPGHFYAYYKPSFLNGFHPRPDFYGCSDFVQAFKGICRDELTVKEHTPE